MQVSKLRQQIFQHCALADRGALLGLLRRAQKSKDATDRERLGVAIAASEAKVSARVDKRPRVSLNADLPFFEYQDKLKQTIREHQVTIVCGETGSGKTTQLPQICIDLGLADRGLIGHTQPRRLAARSVSERIAEELKTEPGQAVGYKVRFSDTTDPNGYVKLMTDGILLAEIQNDRWLNAYQTLIIDEAHERSLNIDLLLGFVKDLLQKRPDLKLIITSATIDPQSFSRYFNDAPIVMVSGRTYPVEMRYRPLQDAESESRDLNQGVLEALDELFRESPQDTLVFFPGERQIREAAERVAKRFHDCEVMPLYARLSPDQQRRIFQRGGRPKIILSTNVAETSLTVPGIRYVIDSGLARISRYSWRARIQRLPIEKVSQASANQRAGRCGRVAAGVCIRLYDEEDFENRAEFTEPEILRTNLASVILQMDGLRFGDVRAFDFLDVPDQRLVGDGYRLLHELKAVDKDDRVTKLGRRIGRFPIDPRLAAMLIRAGDLGCLNEILIISAVLSVQDPRDQSQEKRQAANEKFRLWQDDSSDFLGWLNLWAEIRKQRKALSRNQFSKWCKTQYLSWLRVREWQDIHQQIREQAREMKLSFNSTEADSEAIHRVILGGIPSHIANLDQEGRYQSTRGRQLSIFPASVLAKKTPKWIMAFSLIETGRLYAHTVATINPQWVISDLAHLHQYDYYQPHWQQKQARVGAFRNTRLYGLLVEGGRRVNYASVNPVESREIFIREALVEGQYSTRVEFIRANRKLIDHYREQEERERRRDLLIGEQQVFEFYAQRLPQTVVDGVSFEAWAKNLSGDEVRALTLFDQDVLATDHERDLDGYPEFLEVRSQRLKLTYVFDPADDADGVSVMLPLALLNQFDDADFDFLVPGLLLEKIEALIRALPKALRKNFIPAPDFARACRDGLKPQGNLYQQLSTLLLRMTGVEVKAEQWQPQALDAHFRMRYCLLDEHTIVASGRSLAELKQQFSERANLRFEQQVQHDESISREGLTAWDFDALPKSATITRGGSSVTAFPALVDYHDSVAIELFETAADAAFYHPSGLARLLLLALADKVKYCRKNMPQIEQSALLYLGHGTREELVDDILMASVFACFLSDGLPSDRAGYDRLLDEYSNRFIATVNDIAELVHRVLLLDREQRNRLEEIVLPAAHREDIEEQCGYLVYPGFVRDIDPEHLQRIPTYFQALGKRLDKMAQSGGQADRALPVVRELWQAYLQQVDRDGLDQQALNEVRWLIEEYRINCFAQPMRTRVPVSESRIRKKLEALE